MASPDAPLTASVDDQQAARRARRRALAAERVAAGLCAKCRRPHGRGTQNCARCTAKCVQYQWRQRQARVIERPRREASYNYGTNDLIEAHVRDARKFAYWLSRRLPIATAGVDIEDVVGDALYGLVLAGRTYREDCGVPFRAWAATRIRGEVYNGFAQWTHGHKQRPPTFEPWTPETVEA